MKQWLTSTTNFSQILAFVGIGLAAFGFQLGEGVQEELIKTVGLTISAVSGIYVLIGRFRVGDLYFKTPKPV